MSVKNARKLRNALLIAGFFIMLLGCYSNVIGVIGVVVSFSSLIPHFLYNKCPHCGRQLGLNEEKFCQYCGRPLD